MTWRFQHDLSKKKPTWRVFFTLVTRVDAPVFDLSGSVQGCLGIDFNAGHVSVTQADGQGRFVKTWRFPMLGGGKHGRTTEQVQDGVRQVAANIVALARALHLPVASERLDFSQKKASLRSEHGPKYARMLHSLAYSSFGTALSRAAERADVPHRLVNPAFTSFIARVKHVRPLGLSVHAGAALCIALRAMSTTSPERRAELSEDLPAPVNGKYLIPDDSGVHVTVDAPVMPELGVGEASVHVWSAHRKCDVASPWGRLARGYRAALKARASVGRAARGGRAGASRRLVTSRSVECHGPNHKGMRFPIVKGGAGTGGSVPASQARSRQ